MTTNDTYELGPHCATVTAEQVARLADRGVLQEKATPGVCRFCARKLPVTHVPLELPSGTIQMPLLQCDRVARLAEDAARISARWSLDRMRKSAEEKSKAGKKELW